MASRYRDIARSITDPDVADERIRLASEWATGAPAHGER